MCDVVSFVNYCYLQRTGMLRNNRRWVSPDLSPGRRDPRSAAKLQFSVCLERGHNSLRDTIRRLFRGSGFRKICTCASFGGDIRPRLDSAHVIRKCRLPGNPLDLLRTSYACATRGLNPPRLFHVNTIDMSNVSMKSQESSTFRKTLSLNIISTGLRFIDI